MTSLDRREMFRRSASMAAASSLAWTGVAPIATYAGPARPPEHRVRYCLNMSTLRGHKLTVPDQVRIASQAGYDAIEPWIGDLRQYEERGGSLSDLAKQVADAGLRVESAIGFAPWIVDDAVKRAAGLENMKRDMELIRSVGGTRIAAPPVGATNQPDLDLRRAAQRYRDLLTLGRRIGVTPQLELWGFSQSLSRLGELLYIAAEAGHEDACLLLDVYHIYKGGSDFAGLHVVAGDAVHVLHMNDYPAIEREKISDADRVYPGDGVAPLNAILGTLFERGFKGTLSLELFNRDYWNQPADSVARTGLAKMKAAVGRAVSAMRTG